MNIGIIGQGFVGNAIFQKFKDYFKIFTYDLKKHLSNSSFDFIAQNCNIIFVCVPTPMDIEGRCDISFVEKVLEKLDQSSNAIVVNKSTVVPGSTSLFNKKFKNLDIVFNPEFLTEKNSIKDFDNQNRIILGGSSFATSKIKQIYSSVFPNVPVIETTSKSAEMIKYFTNCFLSTKVSFANEMYELCKALDVDYDKVAEYASLDPRLGYSHLAVPGPDGDFGFGGHCLPKDLSAIIKISDDLGTTNKLLKSTVETNDIVRRNRDWEKMKGRAVN